MKRIVILVLTLVMVFTVTALAQDWSNYSDDELASMIDELEKLLIDGRAEMDRREQARLTQYTSKYADFTVKPYFKDGFELLLEYRWTNTSDDIVSFNLTLQGDAYQNDKKLSTALLLFNPESNRFEDVPPGGTSTAYEAFNLSDMSDITVYIGCPYVKEPSAVITLKLSDLEQYQSK